MAFPQLRGEATGVQNTNSTSHTVTLPDTVNAGDLLRVTIAFDGNPTVTWDDTSHGTWTLLFNVPSGTACRLVSYAKVAAGTEGGGTLTITTSASEQSVHRSSAIYDWFGTLATGVNVATATGTSTTPNPPNNAPGWGAQDILWAAVCCNDNGSTSISGYPANFTDSQFNDRATGTAGVGLGFAARSFNTTSQDPGTFTISASRAWVAAIVAIRPSNATSVALTGSSATGAVGALGRKHSKALTGVAASAAVGTVSASTPVVVPLTGIAATGAVGSLTPSLAYQVTLSGSAATGAVGALGKSHAKSLSGNAAIAATGTLTPSSAISLELSGVAATGNVGALTASSGASVPLTGVAATSTVGNLSVAHTKSLAGSSANATVGSLTPSSAGAVALSGVAATGAVGTLSLGISVSLSGIAASGSVGTLSPATAGAEIARVAQAYFELPSSAERARVAQAYFELPASIERARVTQAYFELPFGVAQPKRDVGAGKSGKPSKRRRRPLLVTIDGETFVVSSEYEAEELIAKAVESANENAKQQADLILLKRAKKSKRGGGLNTSPLRLDEPSISVAAANDGSVDAEWLRSVQARFDEEIRAVYEAAKLNAELELLMGVRMAVLDEEDALVALLLSI